MKAAVQIHDEYAAAYDSQVRAYHSFAAEVLFGLCYEYVNPGERLLDAGIGTGLSAQPFARFGVQVFGADASAEMLDICRAKQIAVQLAQFDLEDTPWDYANDSFHHVIACGVAHFFEDVDFMFRECARVIRTNGIFGFTVKAPPDGRNAIVREDTSGVAIYMHSREYIERCAAKYNFEPLKAVRFFIGDELEPSATLFCAYVFRKTMDVNMAARWRA